MCSGISLSRRDIADVLIERHGLARRVVTRTPKAEPEVQFLFRDPAPLLPVWHGAEFVLYPWGNSQRSRLPNGGWCQIEWLEAGRWSHLHPEPVEIPAMLVLERGVWFHVREGLKGILVRDELRREHVYVLTEPASHYYQTMTKSARMPMLCGGESI